MTDIDTSGVIPIQVIRRWLQGDPAIQDVVGTRVMTPVFTQKNLTKPTIVVAFIGGNEDVYLPTADPILVIKCYNTTFEKARFLQQLVHKRIHNKNMIDVTDADTNENVLRDKIKNGSLDAASTARPVPWPNWDSDGGSDGDGWGAVDSGGFAVGANLAFSFAPTGSPASLRQTVASLDALTSYRLRWVRSFSGSLDAGTYDVVVRQGATELARVTDDPMDAPLSPTELCFTTLFEDGCETADVEIEFEGSIGADVGYEIEVDDVSLRQFMGVILSSGNSTTPQEFNERTTALKYSLSTYRVLMRLA